MGPATDQQQRTYRSIVAANGVGHETAARVVRWFPTLTDIVEAGIEGLQDVPGVGTQLATKIHTAATLHSAGGGSRTRLFRPRRLRTTSPTDSTPDDPPPRPTAPEPPRAPTPEPAPRRRRADGPRSPATVPAVPAQLDDPPIAGPAPPRTGRCLVCDNDVGSSDADDRYPLCGRHQPHQTNTGRGAHGLPRAVRGCRCAVCLTTLAVAAHMVDARTAGHTLSDIGRWYGVTRERVRQVTAQAAPWRPWDGPAVEARALAAELHGQQLAAAAQHRANTQDTPTCSCCDGPVPPPRWRVCSDHCTEVIGALRRHTDPESYRAHWDAVHRHDADAPDPEFDRSLFQERSRTWAHAVIAVRDGWPIADQFLPQAARQLWAWIDHHPDEDPYDHVTDADIDRLADRRWLHARYVTARWSIQRIAHHLGCSTPTVRRALDRHGIEVRPQTSYPLLQDRDWLSRQVLAGRPDVEIGRLAGGATASAVRSARQRWAIPASRRLATYRNRTTARPEGST